MIDIAYPVTVPATVEAPSRRIGAAVVDLLIWMAALAAAFAAQSVVLVNVLGQSAARLDMRDPRTVALLALQPLIVLPVLTLVLRMRGESWADLGLRTPDDPARFIGRAARIVLLLVVLGYALGALTRALIPPQARSPFLDLHGSLPAFIVLFSYSLLLVGLDEELQLRGFVMDRLARVCGGGRTAWASAVAVSSVVFGLAHASHGLGTVVFATGMGVMFGVTYLRTGRNLWIVVVAHSVYDAARVLEGFLR